MKLQTHILLGIPITNEDEDLGNGKYAAGNPLVDLEVLGEIVVIDGDVNIHVDNSTEVDNSVNVAQKSWLNRFFGWLLGSVG